MSTATVDLPGRCVAELSVDLLAAIGERARLQRGGLDTAEETKRIRDLLGARHDALRDVGERTDAIGRRMGGEVR